VHEMETKCKYESRGTDEEGGGTERMSETGLRGVISAMDGTKGAKS
jgi:hypothetical protein